MKFTWGDTVKLKTKYEEWATGTIASVCSIRELKCDNIYLIEFTDGRNIEIPEHYLEIVFDDDAK